MKALVTILLLIVGIVLLGWVARPLWDDVRMLRAQSAGINSVLSTLNEKKQLQQDLINTYNAISNEQLDLLLNQHLPEKQDTGTLLIAFERIAKTSNVRLNNVDFKKAQPQRSTSATASRNAAAAKQKVVLLPHDELGFSFTATASYENFKVFLATLEKHIRVVDITNIAFAGGARESYTFTITGKTYFRK